MRRLLGALFVVLVMTAGSSFAQQIEIEAPTPERPRPPLLMPPGDHFQMTHPSDSNYYPSPPLVNFDPAFIEPLSMKFETPTSTGRFGLSGWVSPATPVGAEATGWRRDPGWFALGFTIEWGGPPPSPPAKRPPLR